jgi:hypothetical protein
MGGCHRSCEWDFERRYVYMSRNEILNYDAIPYYRKQILIVLKWRLSLYMVML